MNPDTFFKPLLGQSLLIPGQSETYRGQCVQSVGLWVQALGYKMPVNPYAYLYYENGIPGFDKVAAGQPVKAGDIVVWKPNFPPSQGAGHIDVAQKNGSANDFWAYDSNWNPRLKLSLIHHVNESYLYGYLRLKEAKPMNYPNEGDLVNIHNSTSWPGHDLTANDKSYWTTGTNNPNWGKGADEVWKALMYEVIGYVVKHPGGGSNAQTLAPGVYQVK